MKAVLYSRPEIFLRPNALERLVEALGKHGIDYMLSTAAADRWEEATGKTLPATARYDEIRESFPADADLMICYGGDGTFLDGVRLLNHSTVPMLGINAGHLGFLTNVAGEEIEAVVAEIAAGKYGIEERSTLNVTDGFSGGIEFPHAINEFTIQKKGPMMVSVDVFIDGERVTAYLGDGLILSTPTGSTAYSLSAGGPIVAPDVRCLVISPIASHNLTIRPLVVPDSCRMSFRVRSRSGGPAWASLDNRNYEVPDGTVFSVEKSGKPVFLVKLHTISFYRTLREKMMWGVDTRHKV
ncbi:MAG: NAD(+)/NADH kinase [Rikenellaceae bacterium]|jgi:NAD+ kinase|nr:NAD(+)/NADH kinase [Rikenellaceae bacterium]